MRMWGVVWLLVALAVSAQAAVLDGRTATRGTLTQPGGQTVAGASLNQVDLGEQSKARWVYFLMRNTTGGSAVVHLDVNCANASDPDYATSWVTVPNSAKTLTGAVLTDAVQPEQPACVYRTVLEGSVSGGANIVVTYLVGADIN